MAGQSLHPVAVALSDEFEARNVAVSEKTCALIDAISRWAQPAMSLNEAARFAAMGEKLQLLRDCIDASADRINAEFDT